MRYINKCIVIVSKVYNQTVNNYIIWYMIVIVKMIDG